MKRNKTTQVSRKSLDLFKVLSEATKLSLCLVFYPVVFLLAGVWLDRNLKTTPLFIVVAIIAGLVAVFFQLLKTSKNLKNE